ncbi:CLCA_X family protein [Pseudoalteromonas sp. T1lg10]|uniref:CLCA_X family protein n=1 Tax=Pseudoalteromonas sp. T1lg10 TaxID=2077093 RepID=UPI000CF72B8B|nr:CLCA_X family protein [Pseudoalteromonas sp. T1lg10]
MTSSLMDHKYRRGPDYRFGVDVDFSEVRTTFGLRAISVGRWVNNEERQRAANLVYDALADLTQILAVPPQVIGLRQTLTLAFAQGGRLGVQAHYQSSTRTLALAKNAGSGAFAHEWWHAFDHYISRFLFTGPTSQRAFASKLWLTRDDYNPHRLNQPLLQLLEHILLNEQSTDSSAYLKRCALLDASAGQYYLAMPEELSARAFEHYVQNAEIKNQYLVSGTKQGELAKLGAYPNEEEAAKLVPCFREYFALLGQALG